MEGKLAAEDLNAVRQRQFHFRVWTNLIDRHGIGVHVAFLRSGLGLGSLKTFGAEVYHAAYGFLAPTADTIHKPAESKIAKLGLAVVSHEDVASLDVAVDDPLAVQVGKTRGYPSRLIAYFQHCNIIKECEY